MPVGIVELSQLPGLLRVHCPSVPKVAHTWQQPTGRHSDAKTGHPPFRHLTAGNRRLLELVCQFLSAQCLCVRAIAFPHVSGSSTWGWHGVTPAFYGCAGRAHPVSLVVVNVSWRNNLDARAPDQRMSPKLPCLERPGELTKSGGARLAARRQAGHASPHPAGLQS